MHARKQLDPDIILSRLQQEELKQSRGRLKIFFGACAGVGKTYAMLEAAHKVKDVKTAGRLCRSARPKRDRGANCRS